MQWGEDLCVVVADSVPVSELLNFSFVQRGGIFFCVFHVFLVGFGEEVGAAEVGVGTHVKVFVLRHVQHGFDAGDGWDADGSGWQSGMQVGVVRAVGVEHIAVDALQSELLACELYRRVGLQGHSFGILFRSQNESVVVHSGNHGFFGVIGRFFINDCCEDGYLQGRELEGLCLGRSVVVPESLVLAVHPFEERVDGGVPIDVVGVGYEDGHDGGGVVPELSACYGVFQGVAHRGAVDHEFVADECGQVFGCSDGGQSEGQGFLQSAFDVPKQPEGTHAGLHGVAAGAYVLVEVAVSCQGAEGVEAVVRGQRSNLGQERVEIIVRIQIDVSHGIVATDGGKEEVVAKHTQDEQAEAGREEIFYFRILFFSHGYFNINGCKFKRKGSTDKSFYLQV